MTPDWRDLRREDRLRFYMVCPTNLGQIYGELDGVDPSGSSLSCGYYTDTRTSGKLRVVGGNWIRGSFVRVVHEVPEWDYSRTLGTYVVTNDDATLENGVWTYELELESMLYALSTDLLAWPVTRAKGSSTLAGMRYVLNTCKRPFVEASPKDRRLGSALVMETGTSMLSLLYGMCDSTGNRLDVDPDGRVTISPYVNPSAKSPTLTIDVTDGRGTTLDGIGRSTDWLSMANRAAVSCKYTETVKKGKKTKSVEREITAYADASANSHAASRNRGYTVTEFHSVSDMKPRTKAQAQKLANKYLANNTPELVQWSVKSTYLPIWEGDVVWLVTNDPDYPGRRKCLVKSVDLDLGSMEMDLTLKETSSGTKGDDDGE